MANYEIGDLVTFAYPAVHLQGTKAHDRYPQVLVLHTRWDRWPPNNRPGNFLVHGLNFNYLSANEINMVRMVMDPSFENTYKEGLRARDPNLVRKFEEIMARAANANITSPHDFYLRCMKPFIQPKQYDPYRLYRPDKMTNVRILQKRQQLEGVPQGPFAKFAQTVRNFGSGVRPLPRPPSRLPSRTPTFGGPHRPGALPGTEDK